MLFEKAVFKPRMAAPIRDTVTIPMMMPRVVSTDRILLERIASQEMSSPSRISIRKFMPGKSRALRNVARRPDWFQDGRRFAPGFLNPRFVHHLRRARRATG